MKGRFSSSAKLLRYHKKTLLLITTAVGATLVMSSLISIWLSRVTNLEIPSIGNIKTRGVEAYWDRNLENRTRFIEWRTVWPGSSQNVTLYIKSVSNSEITLNLTTANWTFLDSSNRIVAGPNGTTPYMNLTWDYNGTIVRPGEALQVTLILYVERSSDFVDFLIAKDVEEFGVDIHIGPL